MDSYTMGKYLHVIVAIAWLGGAFGVVLLGHLAARAGDGERLIWVARMTETLAKLIFMPASLVMLLLGLWLTWLDWSFAEAWIVFGILGVVMTGAIGGRFLTPMVKQLATLEAGAQRDAVAVKFFNTAKADLIMLFTIVWAMVSKPQWADVWEILAMVLVIAAGAVFYLRPRKA